MPPSTGTLPPHEAAIAVLHTGIEHLSNPLTTTFIQNVYGALLLSSGGLFSILLGGGVAGLDPDNAGIERLLHGVAFPFGLVLVYLVGAELFTGYPMWYVMTALERKGSPMQYVNGAIASWLGNLTGALLFAFLFTKATDVLAEEPWHSSIVTQIENDIIDLPWHIVFVRAIACGWLVTMAMYLGTQNQDGISKLLFLHFPFMISATARFPHTVEYMYLSSVGMILGAPLSIGGFFWKCLLPLTLGNVIGGGFFTGLYLWQMHLRPASQKEKYGDDGLYDEETPLLNGH
ncbi:Putative formate/nitrite transporter, aquaporin [Septoria linicola]|uniref:Formate/nitrite transporter, aquaporin n=1 Tax=Septoria linicola TaxID=215465 RepID=A0A9Q9AUW1_9PEZI|nr:putative formate/nitrite transporter, aquaporin [Septoria linicola]USW51131.1 Putative formate/nitrite transporter, aquaporin [Septoria linicola]